MLLPVPVKCGDGMEFKECGDTCMPTCTDPKGNNCADAPCEEGCFCKDGLVYDGVGTCHSPDECGCQVPGSSDRINVSLLLYFTL